MPNDGGLKLRAVITVDFTAADFIAAAEIQKKLKTLCDGLGKEYESCTFDLRERRDRTTRKKHR